MRINLGCGLTYKKGYMNIDAFDATVADQIMPAFNLDLADNVASIIECSQMLEHLGAAKSVYAISECFRVLQPQGTLLLETPDIETTFKTFLKSEEVHRKYLMNWIYGLDSPGMQHQYCFPKDLLNRLLKQTGFEEIRIQRLGKGLLQPILRATCKKPLKFQPYQSLTWTRRTLVQEKIIDLSDQVITLEQEAFLQTLIAQNLQLTKDFDETQLQQMITTIGVHIPRILLRFLKEGVRGKLFSPSQLADSYKVLQALIKINFPRILVFLFQQFPFKIGSQHQTYTAMKRMGKKTVEKLFNKQNRSTILKELRRTQREITSPFLVPLFSEMAIKQLANQQFAIAAKAFAQMKLSDAIIQFNKVFRLDRDNLLIPWNLGRLFALQNAIESSRMHYNQTENLAQQYTLSHRRKIIQRLRLEFQSIERGDTTEIAEPIFRPFV